VSGRKSATALLVAYDGVIWRHDDAATEMIEDRSGLAPGTIRSVAFAPVRAVPAMLGQNSRAAWYESIAAGLADRTGGLETAEKIVEEWSAVRGGIVPELLDFVSAVRERGVPVGVCASGVDELPADLPSRVDAVVHAADLGLAAPHRDYFAAGCIALAVLPKRCLYVDFSPRNIAGARAAGLLAYRYAGLESLSYLRHVFATTA
jgi:putative hydrolase of the HAD superfamily